MIILKKLYNKGIKILMKYYFFVIFFFILLNFSYKSNSAYDDIFNQECPEIIAILKTKGIAQLLFEEKDERRKISLNEKYEQNKILIKWLDEEEKILLKMKNSSKKETSCCCIVQ